MKKFLSICGLVVMLVRVLVGGVYSVHLGAYADELTSEYVNGDDGDEASEAEEGDEYDENDEDDGGDDGLDELLPEIYIKAINPGYKINGVSNTGEMIEIAKRDSDKLFSLAGATVGYTTSSGSYSALFEFPENSWMTGETILLRLASSPGHELASINYTKTLAMKGGLTLTVDEEVVDEVCWTGQEGCYKPFTSTRPTSLVRNDESGGFEHLSVYEPEYNPDSYYVEVVEGEPEVVASQCKGLQFSEVLSYYESEKSEQFIELYNDTARQILLDGCKIRYKNKNYVLSGVVQPEGYFVYHPVGFSLTKNPTNFNVVSLVDTDGGVVDELKYSNGQRKGASYALIGNDETGGEIWRVTYAPTPGEPNDYQEYKTCEEGKVINKATGNCVKATSVKNKTCKVGYYVNPLTGRCKKLQVAKEKTCKEGYYLNPETNRCRKIKENKGADYSLQPEEYDESVSFAALYAVLGVVGLALGYVIYEYRKDIKKLFEKVFRRFH